MFIIFIAILGGFASVSEDMQGTFEAMRPARFHDVPPDVPRRYTPAPSPVAPGGVFTAEDWCLLSLGSAASDDQRRSCAAR